MPIIFISVYSVMHHCYTIRRPYLWWTQHNRNQEVRRNFVPANVAMICGSLSAFVTSVVSGLCVSIGVLSCSVFRCDNSVSIVPGLVPRSTMEF